MGRVEATEHFDQNTHAHTRTHTRAEKEIRKSLWKTTCVVTQRDVSNYNLLFFICGHIFSRMQSRHGSHEMKSLEGFDFLQIGVALPIFKDKRKSEFVKHSANKFCHRRKFLYT